MEKLTKNGEDLLKEILEHRSQDGICDIEYWRMRLDKLSFQEEVLIRSVFKELTDAEMISIKWASNLPYILIVLSKGIQYFESSHETQSYPSNSNYFYSEVNSMQIQQGTINSNQTLNINQELDFESINELIQQVNKYRDFLESEYGEEGAKQLQESIDQLTMEIAENKSPNRIKNILNYIKELSVNVAGGLISEGIVCLVKNMMG